MVYDQAKQLAVRMRESEEYRSFCEAKERAFANASTRTLLNEYHKLRRRAQANVLSGEHDETLLMQLQKLGEALQFDADAADYLLAEYRLGTMLGDIYKILAEAVDMDLNDLEG